MGWLKNLLGGSPAAEPPLNRADQRKYAYIRYLPEPSEATINVLQAVSRDKNAFRSSKSKQSDDVFSMAVSSMESPSSRLAVDLFVKEASGNPNAYGKVTVARVQEPDPREPIVYSKFLLWEYNGTDPRPAFAAPEKVVAADVAGIAASPFDIENWKKQAQKVAAKTGLWRINHLLGVMVNPPPRPKNMPVWVWLQRVQIAAALVIAYLEKEWQKSQRRKALLGLALGQMDWTTGAAIIALTELAQDNPRIAAELTEAIRRIMDARPDEGGVSYEYTLACCGLRIPGLPADLKRTLTEMRRNFEKD